MLNMTTVLSIWLYTLASVIIVSLISLVGIITIIIKHKKIDDFLHLAVAFSAGALLGDAFLHLIPESFEIISNKITISFLIITGIMIFFVLEKFVNWRHCHVPTSHDHPHPYTYTNLIGDALHNFTDGIVIGSSYLVSIPLGIATTFAVVLHEIPHELGNFGVLIHGGFKPKKALFLNFLTALTSILGAILVLLVGTYLKDYTNLIIPITAGGFIYIASSDLIPEIHKEIDIKKSIMQFVAIILGVASMWLLLFLGG